MKRSKKRGIPMSDQRQYYEMSDRIWALLEPHLSGQRGQWGGIAKDNREFINGVFWVLSTGSPWRRLPQRYGKWGTVYQRFRRWRDRGIWENLLELLVDEPEFEWLVVDTGQYRAQSHRAGPGDEHDAGGYFIPRFTLPWIQMVCRSEYLSERIPQLIARKLFP